MHEIQFLDSIYIFDLDVNRRVCNEKDSKPITVRNKLTFNRVNIEMYPFFHSRNCKLDFGVNDYKTKQQQLLEQEATLSFMQPKNQYSFI